MSIKDSIKENVKQNPIATAVSLLILISMLGSAAWGAEVRYNQSAQFIGVEKRMLEQQIETYDDKIFEYQFLENQGKATPLDKALKERIKQKRTDKQDELKELNKK